MNLRQKPKIMMLFSGFANKYNENKDYFQMMNIFTVSGGKKYLGKVVEEDDLLKLNFGGVSIFENFNDLLEFICETILKYDAATVEYVERGLGTRITVDDKNVKLEKFELKETTSSIGLKVKEYNLDLQKSASLLKTLGFMTEDGKLKNDMIRKYNQTDRFLDLVGDMFDNKDDITIVDCACGKSYLSFILNYYLWEQRHVRGKFVGIDIKENVVKESQFIAEKLGYKNMKFICEDLKTFSGEKPDVVISLHACDIATDMALGYAIRNNVKSIICVPCCHKELLDKFEKPDLEPFLRHGIFRARFNDILTDGLRTLKLEACGYKVSCVEYCSPLDTPKNLLIKAEKVAQYNKSAEHDYYTMLSNLKVMPSIEYYSLLKD